MKIVGIESGLFLLLLVTATLIGCGGGGDESESPLPVSTFEVDSTIQPSMTELPGFTSSGTRPLAALVDEDGKTVDFISNELWVSTEDDAALAALITRWNGEVLITIDAASTKIDNFPTQVLIRVDASTADITGLAEDAHKLLPDRRGDMKVSSEAGLRLLAISAEESLNGITAGLNFVGKPSFLNSQTRESYEASTGTSVDGSTYDANAFNWEHLNAGSTQNIGVTDAWRALDAAGRLTPGSVKLAILDMGFVPDDDFPADWIAISNVPFVAPTGTGNLIGCGDGNDCPWHGTNAVGAAMGVAGNDYGAAGPAGPVADAVLVFTSYDYGTSIAAIAKARIAGARIVNMSYSSPIPYYAAWTVYPFDIATKAFRNQGDMLLFASAGNEGDSVDAEKCVIGFCWEKEWVTPCENDGVICIGGLDINSKSRAPDSNYGSEHVDLFAPFTVLVGPDPDNPANAAYSISGTSFSSPYVAGVAALVKAADPDLNADQIEAILLETAHVSSDDEVDIYVNAGAAVRLALGSLSPNLELVSPADGSERGLNHSVSFWANVDDFEDGVNCCDITWSSNLDGLLNVGNSFDRSFTTTGQRVITVSTVDSSGATASLTFTLNIVNTAPSVTITKPLASENIIRGVSYTMRGTSFDTNEVGTSLPCSAMSWTSSNGSDVLGTGCERAVVFSSNGARTLTLTGTDSEGSIGTDTVSITVVEPPVDLPPSVLITSPANGSSISSISSPMSLSANVSDDNDNLSALAFEWTVTHNASTTVIGTAKNISWTPSDTINFSSDGTYNLIFKLTVTDTGGNKGVDFVDTETIIIG